MAWLWALAPCPKQLAVPLPTKAASSHVPWPWRHHHALGRLSRTLRHPRFWGVLHPAHSLGSHVFWRSFPRVSLSPCTLLSSPSPRHPSLPFPGLHSVDQPPSLPVKSLRGSLWLWGNTQAPACTLPGFTFAPGVLHGAPSHPLLSCCFTWLAPARPGRPECPLLLEVLPDHSHPFLVFLDGLLHHVEILAPLSLTDQRQPWE